MRRHRRRQQQPLHARGAGQLVIEAIAALAQLALEMLARQVGRRRAPALPRAWIGLVM